MNANSYDPEALLQRAQDLRAQATAGALEADRHSFLREAEDLERRANQSLGTAVLLDAVSPSGWRRGFPFWGS